MDKIKLKDEYIKSNLLYEEDITKSLLCEIESIDEYLDFVFEHKENEIIIKRNTINVETEDGEYCPSSYYGAGKEMGTYIETEDGSKLYNNSEEGIYESNPSFNYNWVEWNITYENATYRDSFEIVITPFVFNMYSFSSESHKNDDGYNREKINIFTSSFYDKWNDKLKDIIIKKKKIKIKTMINDSYKILGIDRQAKIKSILN